MTLKLRRCPFCGKVPKSPEFGDSQEGPYLICPNCLADGPPAMTPYAPRGSAKEKRHQKKAAEAWNKRAS